jgi:hypothetical protein
MNEFQREVMEQIKRGIDRARHEGVRVDYPTHVEIDGVKVPWPFPPRAGNTTPNAGDGQ